MVPTFACCFTIFSILSGSTFFQEFKGFCVVRIVLFAIAVIISLVGVALLYPRVPGEGQPGEIITAESVAAPRPVHSSAESRAAGATSSARLSRASSHKSYPALPGLSWLSAASEAAAVSSEVLSSTPRPAQGHNRTISGGAAGGAGQVGTATCQKPMHRRTHSEPVNSEVVTVQSVTAV